MHSGAGQKPQPNTGPVSGLEDRNIFEFLKPKPVAVPCVLYFSLFSDSKTT